MSSNLFTSKNGELHISSYTGPVTTQEHTRVRLQLDVMTDSDAPGGLTSLGFDEVLALHHVLATWLVEHNKYDVLR